MILQVLLVDDEQTLLSVFKRLIEQTLSAKVFTAGDGDEALRILRSERIDLLISDVTHPPPDGVEILKTLQSDPQLSRIPVLIQSASLPRRELEVWRAGARAVLQKPFALNEFFTVIERLAGTIVHPDKALLEFGSETQALDYKEVLPLRTKAERASIAKDVIAFANTGGGVIIVGVAERDPGRFELKGVSSEQQESLETTRLNLALRSYLDPTVPVRSRIVEHRGRSFVFLEVPSAEAELVMAKINYPDSGLFRGRIYGRTTASESAALETAAEIRSVVARLARNMLRGSRASISL